MEKGHFGQYSGNARHSRTPVTRSNYRSSVADDAAHIHYLKEDINYDAKHGHSDENMTADEKHISKLAGDMKYDKKHHGSPAKQVDEREGNPKTGKNVTYRLKGTSHMYDDEGFLLPQYSGASQSNQDAEYGIILSDLNTMDQRTYSIGDEERDFEYRDGGYQITRGGTREQNIFPSARGTGVVTNSMTRQYTPGEMKDIVRQTREYNRPILDAVKRSNRGDYTQEQIDIYNKRQDKYQDRYRRRPGQPTLSPRYRSARG